MTGGAEIAPPRQASLLTNSPHRSRSSAMLLTSAACIDIPLYQARDGFCCEALAITCTTFHTPTTYACSRCGMHSVALDRHFARDRQRVPRTAQRGDGVPSACQLEPNHHLTEADQRLASSRLSTCRSSPKAVQ